MDGNYLPASFINDKKAVNQLAAKTNYGRKGRYIMPLIQLIIVLVVVGVVLWAINSFIPMQSTIKGILNLVVIIAVIIWLLSVFGLIGDISNIRIGR